MSDKFNQALTLYQRITADGEQDYALLSLLFCHSVLRHVGLLVAVWSSKGWGPLAFTAMLHSGGPYQAPALANATEVDIERLSLISTIARSTISNVLSQAHGPWLLHLGPRERIYILEATASVYSSIGYRRKEAYILREVLGCVLDLLVCGREEDGLQRNAQMGLGIQMPGTVGGKGQHVGVRFSESTEGNSSLLQILTHACRVLGIDLDAVPLVDAKQNMPAAEENLELVASRYEQEVLEGPPELHGWPELQVGVIREAVAVAEALPGTFFFRQLAYYSCDGQISLRWPSSLFLP